MQIYTSATLAELDKRKRTNLINSVLGFKPALLLGTRSLQGATNLALISSVVHIGASPPLIGLIFRPNSVPRHSLENILATENFTLNHIHANFVRQAHQTSARYPREVSEFDATGLGESYGEAVKAPYVTESRLGIGLELRQQIPIELNHTSLIIGEVVELRLPDQALLDDGYLNSEILETVTLSGLDSYHLTERIARLSYAKPDSMPVEK